MTDGWQPIETAPRDMTYVVIATKSFSCGWVMARWHRYNGLSTWHDMETDTYPDATHWMLPSPPPETTP